jgi:hemolysin-activating ACP:hemolysin acyltransferase
MRVGQYEIKAPLMLGGTDNEAEVLGASVWLWMHSPMHRDAPLHALPTLLLPIIKRRQYVLIMENERPVFFLSWAWLNPESKPATSPARRLTWRRLTGTAATGCGFATGSRHSAIPPPSTP